MSLAQQSFVSTTRVSGAIARISDLIGAWLEARLR
jgi:hypothetical protein